MRTGMRVMSLLLLLLAILVGGDLRAETIYRCELNGGVLFTNRAELKCPVHELTGALAVVPNAAQAAAEHAALRRALEQAEGLRAMVSPAEPVWPVTLQPLATANQPQISTPCQAYRDWIALGTRTFGGTQFQSVDDRRLYETYRQLFQHSGIPQGC